MKIEKHIIQKCVSDLFDNIYYDERLQKYASHMMGAAPFIIFSVVRKEGFYREISDGIPTYKLNTSISKTLDMFRKQQ